VKRVLAPGVETIAMNSLLRCVRVTRVNWLRATQVGLLALTCFASAETSQGAAATNASPRRFKIPRAIVSGFPEPRADPSKVAIGERLFLETRFSQFFFANSHGDANVVLPAGDPVVATTVTTNQPLPGPFAGYAINCRACHLVNEHATAGFGNRTYADYARRSPVPARGDGQKFTARTAPPMVNATVSRERDLFLHWDGEFVSGEDLVRGTFTGRNFGWLPEEHDQAMHHIAHIVRDDDGRGPLARDFGGYSYAHLLAGEDPELGEETEHFRLPEELRLDVKRATDQQILDAVARLVSLYTDSLFFSRDERSEYDSSPYDCFLETNTIPRRPDPGMTTSYYIRNVHDYVESIKEPIYVTPTNGFRFPQNGRFKTLDQKFSFGPQELLGMKKKDWEEITEDIFKKTFKNSAVKRTKFAGLKRNIEFLKT